MFRKLLSLERENHNNDMEQTFAITQQNGIKRKKKKKKTEIPSNAMPNHAFVTVVHHKTRIHQSNIRAKIMN